MTSLIPINEARRVSDRLPVLARSRAANTNSASFHVIKLPAPNLGDEFRFRHLVAEFAIQPLGQVSRQAIWWNSYVVLATPGRLTRGTGVYTEWNEFATGGFAAAPIVSSTNGILIADISKGVLNGSATINSAENGVVLRKVDLSAMSTKNVEIFAVLITTGMHDGEYQVHGQATLEMRIGDNT